MCTAITLKTKDFYFGRTLDLERSYGEEVVVTPRKYPFEFRNGKSLKTHYAIIGTACIRDGYPLYYDAVNEKGLCMAGLNFVGNAFYCERSASKPNIAQFEFIPYILGKCSDTDEAEREIRKINLWNTSYSKELPVAELHWIIADAKRTITVEFVRDGLKIYENEVGVLTNNPTFDIQMFNLNNYMSLSPESPQNNFCRRISLVPYSLGMGAMGLPGDTSSQSRFIRAAFTKLNSVSGNSEEESVNRFFHVLGNVQQTRGNCKAGDDFEITVYTSCCNASKGLYYYTTYDNHCISAVALQNENLDGEILRRYPHKKSEKIDLLN